MTLSILVPYIGPSTNAIYAGVNRFVRMGHKTKAVKALASLGPIVAFKVPVAVTITPHLGKGKRAYDISNYSYTYKLIEDALVKSGVLQDDSSEYVRSLLYLPPVRVKSTISGLLITLESVNP